MMLARCPWYVAGPMLGLLVIGLRAMLNRGFGAAGGYVDVAQHAFTPSRLGFNGYLLGGFVLGGAVFATGTGQFTLAWDYPSLGAILIGTNPATRGALLLLAGVAIGFGARLAGGCTSGHGVTGTSLGSPASLVSTMTFFATAVAVANLAVWLAGSVR